jgi:DNA repair protein SbcD/Mre11
MRVVHLADLHLGYRQYQRLTRRGLNQREADVARTFERAITQVISCAPDLILIAGDVFHSVRPSNPTIIHAFQQLARLRLALPDAAVVMIAGNHDAPRTNDTGCILELFEGLGVHVADRGAEWFELPQLDCAVLAVPDLPELERPPLERRGTARYQLLLVHGEVRGLPGMGGMADDRAALTISRDALRTDQFDYIALGHYHVHHEVASNAFYAGSLDYTSSNPWGELRAEQEARLPGKGFIERDLATGRQQFHHVEPSRRLIDLPSFDATGLSVREIDTAIAAAVERVPDGIDDAIVRLVVHNVPRHVLSDLDHKQLRDIRRRALNFRLDAREPEREARSQSGSGAPTRKRTLPQLLRETLSTRPLPSDVARETFVATGLAYLEQASAGLASLLDGDDDAER